MFKIKVLLPNGRNIHFPETVFSCPNCGAFLRYFSISPTVCTVCLTTMPEIDDLRKSVDARKEYYLVGFN